MTAADARGGAFGSEFILVDSEDLHSRRSEAGASSRRILFLDIEATDRSLWCYFVADAVKRDVLGGEYPRDRVSESFVQPDSEALS